jgi:hypothetical protein
MQGVPVAIEAGLGLPFSQANEWWWKDMLASPCCSRYQEWRIFSQLSPRVYQNQHVQSRTNIPWAPAWGYRNIWAMRPKWDSEALCGAEYLHLAMTRVAVGGDHGSRGFRLN